MRCDCVALYCVVLSPDVHVVSRSLMCAINNACIYLTYWLGVGGNAILIGGLDRRQHSRKARSAQDLPGKTTPRFRDAILD